MKVFKNPVTGETFEDISVATEKYCLSHPCSSGGCKYHDVVGARICRDWALKHQEEAAELMGLVVEEAEVISAPRLPEVLGVVEDEEWNFPGLIRTYRIHNGVRECFIEGEWKLCDNESILTHIINHPESIIRAPRLTEPEIAIMRSLGAKWARWESGTYLTVLYETEENDPIAYVDHSLFPSLKQGEEIRLEEAEK